jgi:cold shock CspA family protein
MNEGHVISFGTKGFGWIRLENSREAIFFHIRDVLGKLILEEGDKVEFEAITTPKGGKAIRVRLIEEAASTGGAR